MGRRGRNNSNYGGLAPGFCCRQVGALDMHFYDRFRDMVLSRF